ncbi:MAG: TPM domain-containing protein [Polyangiaceae bacterium]
MRQRFVAFAVLCALFVFGAQAWAFTPPANDGPITDAAGKLSPADKQRLDDKLRAYKNSSGNEISYFITPTLDGEDIAAVGYDTARAWKLGTKEKEKDVLVVIAPNDRKVFVETAKGAGGDVTDLQGNQLVEQVIGPRLRDNDFAGAIDKSSDVLMADLGDAGTVRPHAEVDQPNYVSVVIFIFIIGFVIWIAIKIRGGGGGGGRGGGGGPFWFGGGGYGGGGFGGGGGGFGGFGGGGGGGGWGGGGGGWGGGGGGGSY